MGTYLEFIEYDEDWTKDRKKIGEIWMSYFHGVEEKNICHIINLVSARNNEYSMPCPYGGYMEILFRDELEELIEKVKKVRVPTYRRNDKKYILNVLTKVLEYMDKHQLGAVSKEWW